MVKTSPILKISNLSKKFDQLVALDNISFDVPKNSIFAILGPNGSGKSTLMRIIARLITNWDGDIFYESNSIRSNNNYLNNFGFIIESPSFYEYLSAQKNLEIFSRLTETPRDRIAEVLELVDLSGRAKDKVSNYSYGMKQRLGIAQTLLHDPEVLILDEPNNGLDPVGINQISDILFHLKHLGKTICVSTHSLSEVDRICTDVAILKNGKLLVSQNLESLEFDKRFYRVESNNIKEAKDIIKSLKSVKILLVQNHTLILSQNITENSKDIMSTLNNIDSIKSIHPESRLIEYFYA